MTLSSIRDEVAWKVCNWVLKHIATPNYGTYINLAIRYGILRQAQDGGYAESFREFWIPDEDARYKMLAGFLNEEEGAVLTTDDGHIVFLSSDEIKVTKVADYTKK